MCGIAGLFRRDRRAPVEEELLRSMAQAIAHRGPDGEGVRTAPGYGLAHRRLSIVDLADGAQPMGHDGVWVTYNGEIYNFRELRAELEAKGHRFVTRCDTEVVVHGWREWGEALPGKLRGMFAFAIVDEREHALFAARDRLGKKPFHWSMVGDDFLFGSELKALLVHPGVSRELDPESLGAFLCLRYVPDPATIFSSVHKLPPGHCLTVRDGRVDVRSYWQLAFPGPSRRSFEELAEAVCSKLDEAVRIRLMGDVPLGAFLSGGVDSFAVVESMSRVSDTEVIACTMGFEGDPRDERPMAREAARRCGATLHEDAIDPEDMLDQAWFDATFDEPFSDSSAVPTYHVSRLARRHVTVALSGDGGDENFAGYRRYRFDVVENRVRRRLPRAVWSALGAIYPKLDFLPRAVRFKRTFQNLARSPGEAYARSVSAALPDEVRPLLRGAWRAGGEDPLRAVRAAYEAAATDEPLERCVAADLATWLPGDILAKVDRASMAVSLEVRCPFLDHELVELAATVPTAMKLAGGETKAFLRKALAGRLGEAAMRRPKQGFDVPARAWMAGRLGDALETALAEESLAAVVDTAAVRRMLERHRAGLRDHSQLLWSILAFHRFQSRWL